MEYGKIDFEGILGVPFFNGYSDSSALWVGFEKNTQLIHTNSECTVCCRFFQPKQKIPKGLSIFLSKVVIQDLELVETRLKTGL